MLNTYLFEVHYKKGDFYDYTSLRAIDKLDAYNKITRIIGDCTVLSVSRVGN